MVIRVECGPYLVYKVKQPVAQDMKMTSLCSLLNVEKMRAKLGAILILSEGMLKPDISRRSAEASKWLLAMHVALVH